jgi:hypothetical protein
MLELSKKYKKGIDTIEISYCHPAKGSSEEFYS